MTQGKKSPMPQRVLPMLCKLKATPMDNDQFLYEVKWDGYRIISYVSNGKVLLASRSGLNYTSKYPTVVQALKRLKRNIVLDGELIAINQAGKIDFGQLQGYRTSKAQLSYMVFDILWMDGYSYMDLPLETRKQILQTVIKENDVIHFSETFDNGSDLFKRMQEQGMEGIVAKKKDSPYLPGNRGGYWFKTPTRKKLELVIGGWAESDKNRPFSTLLLGAYDMQGNFRAVGHSGGGYTDNDMKDIAERLKKLEIKQSPFVNEVKRVTGTKHYVKPRLVANYEISDWTASGSIRKPAIFKGLRFDKKATDVILEVPKELEAKMPAIEPAPDDQQEEPAKKFKPRKFKYLNEDSEWKKVDRYPPKEYVDMDVDGCRLQLTDINNEIWNDVPKIKLLLYYSQMAEFILPYVKDRPQSLNIKLFGPNGDTTFIKDMENRQPKCSLVYTAKREIPAAGKRNRIDYLICNNKETLLYIINERCIDVNTWTSTKDNPRQPDYVLIDLDPTIPDQKRASDRLHDQGFAKAVQVARYVGALLKKLKVTAFVKTSGKTGLHIYIPVVGFTNVQCRHIAKMIAEQVHAQLPDISTLEFNTSRRGDKVYLDIGQNDYADTIAAPYCVRGYRRPLVSTPLKWSELREDLDRNRFTMESIHSRIEKYGDLFSGVLDKKIAGTNSEKLLAFIGSR